MVFEDTKEFFRKGILRDLIMIVEGGLRAPADVQGGVDVRLAPLHNVAELIPVVHLMEIQIFHGSSGDDHAVKILRAHLGEGRIKGVQMAAVGVMTHITGGSQQLDLNLERCVGELTQELRFGHNFCRHQV